MEVSSQLQPRSWIDLGVLKEFIATWMIVVTLVLSFSFSLITAVNHHELVDADRRICACLGERIYTDGGPCSMGATLSNLSVGTSTLLFTALLILLFAYISILAATGVNSDKNRVATLDVYAAGFVLLPTCVGVIISVGGIFTFFIANHALVRIKFEDTHRCGTGPMAKLINPTNFAWWLQGLLFIPVALSAGWVLLGQIFLHVPAMRNLRRQKPSSM